MGKTFSTGLLTNAISTDSSNRVGIGTTSPSSILEVKGSTTTTSIRLGSPTGSGTYNLISLNGNSEEGQYIGLAGGGGTDTNLYIQSGNAGSVLFRTGNGSVFTERMRITSGGVVCINSSSAYSSEKMRIAVAGSGYCLQLSDTTNTSWQVLQGFNASGGDLGSIQRNGGSLAVLYNTSSDIRLKENVSNAESALDKISKIKVRQFDWIGCNMHQEYGFIAQELNEVYPEVVNSQSKTWGVDYGKLTPILLKAIQELKAEIDALKNK